MSNETENPATSQVSSDDLLASLVVHIHCGYAIIQKQEYIEDGWYIKLINDTVQLWEISQYGGDEYLIGQYFNVIQAYEKAITLS